MSDQLKPEHCFGAFPSTNLGEMIDAGMALWDYFAAAAIAGMRGEEIVPQHVAKMAADIADAMMAERDKRRLV